MVEWLGILGFCVKIDYNFWMYKNMGIFIVYKCIDIFWNFFFYIVIFCLLCKSKVFCFFLEGGWEVDKYDYILIIM